MVPLDAGWSDLGAWDAVWNVLPKDQQGNAHMGDVLTTESRNTLVHASSRLVSLVGVKDLIVIETPDAVLVADKTRSQDVKHIVTQLQATKREEHSLHRKVHRPWGWYDSIDEGGRFKVKRIQVKPGASGLQHPLVAAHDREKGRGLFALDFFAPEMAGASGDFGAVELVRRIGGCVWAWR